MSKHCAPPKSLSGACKSRRATLGKGTRFAPSMPIAASLLAAFATAMGCGARASDTRDMVQLAVRYEHGEGVPKDLPLAIAMYCEAARMGDAEALYNLGWMYANGRGVVRDDRYAATLFSMASTKGHRDADKMLRYLGQPGAEGPECIREQPTYSTPADNPDDDDFVGRIIADNPDRRQLVDLVNALAPRYNVDPRLALAVIATESGFNIRARSPKNAQGLMQLIPETAERFNVRNAYDPVQNIKGGLAYLRWLLAYFRGDVALVAAGYNAGEGAVDRFRGVPPFRETQDYVRKILDRFRKHSHPFDESVTAPTAMLSARRVEAKPR